MHRDVPRASHWRRKNEKFRSGGEFLVIEPAIPAREPIAPNRPKLILLAVVPACALTGAAVMLAEQLDTSLVGLVLIVGVAYVGAHHDAVISLLTPTGS